MNSSDLQGYIAGAQRRQQQKQMRLDDRYALLQALAQQVAATSLRDRITIEGMEL